MADFTGHESIELTIRAAQLGKTVLSLVGVKDETLARMTLHKIMDEVSGLALFVKREAATAAEGK